MQWVGKGAERATTGLQRPPAGCSGALMVRAHGKGGVIMHRFSSPAWVKHVQKAITPLQTLTATEMAALGSEEAYLWANKASDKAITQ